MGSNTKTGLLFEKFLNLKTLRVPKHIKVCKKKEFNRILITEYGIPKENLYREPDVAFIDYSNMKIFIIEQKYQQVRGSVDTKLWSSVAFKEIYQKNIYYFNIEYGLYLSSFFINKFENEKKYKDLLEYLTKNKIKIFFEDDKNTEILKWIKEEVF